jgi:pyruvate,water dikinase
VIEPWPFDSGLDPALPYYTRGNADEVLPDVLTPLMCTLGQPLIERAFRRMFVDVLPVIDEPAVPASISVVVGGRSYLNLSLSRRTADLSPGVSAEDFDHQFAESGLHLPPYERPDEPGYEQRGERMAAAITALLMEFPVAMIADDRATAQKHREEGRAARPTMDIAALLARVDDLSPFFVDTFLHHVMVSTMSSVTFGALSKGLIPIYGDEGPDVARRLLSGLGDAVDSAAPAQHLLRMDRAEFLAQHGYRGANEWEIGSPSWELVPDAVDAVAAAAEHAPAKPDTAAIAARARARVEDDGIADRWPEYGFWLPRAEFYVGHRERTKATAVMVFNEMRLDVFAIGAQLFSRPSDVALCTIAELRQGVVEAGIIEARRTHMALLQDLVPPILIDAGNVAPLDQWERVATGPTATRDELRGVAGAPGTATGRVRVVRDPYADAPPQPGEVLVAPITDPGWTLLFVAAEAVVVAVGGELSHAVIVARELGIPAVVSVPGCCDELADGDVVEVNGSTGVVRVLRRAPR